MKWNLKPVEPIKSVQRFKSFKTLAMLMLLAGWTTTGCRQQMADQPYAKPLEADSFFDDGMASRPVVPGSVRHGGEQPDELLYAEKVDGKLTDALPFAVTIELLERGQERYDIFCSPCHDRLGTGRGMIVRRGFTPARSFHDRRLRDAPAGHYFEVISLGFGSMPSYATQLSRRDRWAVIAYIRALQLSRSARVTELAPQDREKLKGVK